MKVNLQCNSFSHPQFLTLCILFFSSYLFCLCICSRLPSTMQYRKREKFLFSTFLWCCLFTLLGWKCCHCLSGYVQQEWQERCQVKVYLYSLECISWSHNTLWYWWQSVNKDWNRYREGILRASPCQARDGSDHEQIWNVKYKLSKHLCADNAVWEWVGKKRGKLWSLQDSVVSHWVSLLCTIQWLSQLWTVRSEFAENLRLYLVFVY